MMANSYSIADIQTFIAGRYASGEFQIIPFAYNVIFQALAQGQTASQVVNIAANADFVALGFSHRAQIGAAQTVSNKTAPFVRLLITDTGSNQQFTQNAVDLESYSTNDAKMRPLPYPRIVTGRSALTFQVTNYAPTAETYTTLEIVMSGVQVYKL